jgi:starvation-inducible DNA-binding protein
MNKTSIQLSPKLREQMVSLLNARLADLIDLNRQATQAHWNIKGEDFYALHKFFEDLAEGLEDTIDDVAERAVQLGGIAEGAIEQVAAKTSLPKYPGKAKSADQHLRALHASYMAIANQVRKDVDTSADAGDALTSDLLTGLGRLLDKQLWFVESHLQ